jgi:hypothetical protein
VVTSVEHLVSFAHAMREHDAPRLAFNRRANGPAGKNVGRPTRADKNV